MRKSVCYTFLSLLVLGGCLCFTSCTDEGGFSIAASWNRTIESPHTTDGTLLLANGDVLAFTLELNKEKSSENIRSASVKYSFDGEEVASVSSFPFRLNYLIQGKSVDSEHTMSWVAEVKDSEDNTNTSTGTCKVKILKETFAADLTLGFGDNVSSISTMTVGIEKGETFAGYVDSLENNVGAQVKSVSYSWDGNVFLTTSKFPFSFSRATADESEGTHKLAYAYTVETYYGECELDGEMYVIVE